MRFSLNVGNIVLTRRYDECLPCRLPEHVADEPLGLEGSDSIALRVCRVRSERLESVSSYVVYMIILGIIRIGYAIASVCWRGVRLGVARWRARARA